MKVFFKNLRRPCTRVDDIDDYNRKMGNQNLSVSSQFPMKNFHGYWAFSRYAIFVQIFSFEPSTPKNIENWLK